MGIGFTAAVFATFLCLGLGFFGVLESIKEFSVGHGIATALACAVGVLALVLAVWSLMDFVRYKRSGDTRQMTLGLPASVKNRIHKVIRVGLSTRGLLIGSIGVGVLVALLESLRTAT